MSDTWTQLGSIKMQLEQPTNVTFAELSDWVLWQYPRFRGSWLCGAAHPPEPGYGWIPARIQPQKRRVTLYGDCCQPLKTPEDAAEWVADHADAG